MIDPSPDNADQLLTHVDCLRARTLIVPTIPLLCAAFHLHHIVGRQGKTLEMTSSSHGTRGDEVVQQQRVEGLESTTRTLDGLVDGFGGRVNTVGIIASGPHVLDIVSCLELFEALGAGIVDLLGIRDKLGRRGRSVGGRHFDVEDGLMV